METLFDMEDRIIELESKIAFLENYIQELNKVVIQQEKRITNLSVETEN